MNNHRENALAFGLSRALAMLEKASSDRTSGKSTLTFSEIEAFKAEMHPLLSRRHTLPNPAQQTGWDSAAIVGAAKGWLIQVLNDPIEDVAKATGSVKLCVEEGQEYKPNGTAVLFRLARDPGVAIGNVTTNCLQIAYEVARFVQLVLDAKGLDKWATQSVHIRQQTIQGFLLSGCDFDC